MNCVRWLLSFRERRSQRDRNAIEAARPPPAILKLPDEILLEIIDHLALHDEFLLSQTCRTFRRLTQRNWRLDFPQFSYPTQINFWTGLAYVLPNHWICGPCCKLHVINRWDRPEVNALAPPCQQQYDLNFDAIYPLRHTHVQLALKLTRMGSVNQSYLEYIMSPFTTEKTSSPYHRLRLTYYATPKVVAERFLLQVKREFRDSIAAVFPTELRLEHICPHMIIMPSEPQINRQRSQILGLDGLSKDVHFAFASFGREFTGHCKRCPTDYTVLAHPGMVTIYSWHDLGSHRSPYSQQWTVHIRTRHNRFFDGPLVHHHPGTIRDRYLEGSVDGRATEV